MPAVQSRPRLEDIGLAEAWRRLSLHFAGTVWRAGGPETGGGGPYGKLLLIIWGIFLSWVGARMLGLGRKKGGRKALKEDKGGKVQTGVKPKRGGKPVKELLKLVKDSMFTKHGVYFVLYVLSLCSRIVITVKLADYGGLLGALMGAREFETMFRGQARFGLWCITASVATASMKFLEKRVALSLRGALYRAFLGEYLQEDSLAYYRVASLADVSDPPARITADLDEFSTAAVHTLGHMLKPTIDIIHLCTVIASRIGLPSLMIFLSFFGLSQSILKQVHTALPTSLKSIAMQKSELDSEFRRRHQLLHDYREQIALQKGTECERAELMKRFRAVEKHSVYSALTSSFVDVISSYVLKYGGAMCGFSVLIPGVYYGDPSKSRRQVTSEYLANSTLLVTLATSIKDFADAYQEVPRLSGLAERVAELHRAVKALPPVVPPKKGTTEEGVIVEGLSVAPPGHATLLNDVSVTVSPGQHTVIRGPNGSGKTSLFRTISGLWAPPTEPKHLQLPEGVFAVPQESYFPFGTLRQQVTYPGPEDKLSDKDGAELLAEVGLTEVMEREEGGLNAVQDWRMKLSGGQKQRLAWARMLFRRPQFALVDEGTSAVATAGIDELHKAAKARGVTLLSVSHHPVVDSHHKQALSLETGGKWKVSDINS